ncbi:hypothetical protein BJF95_08395 [Rhizobium oryziradicis]|uniref:Uncharacterized protein n=2 Tax=Rhizobium oryziradicis TaxID=1867956 RepID=A0A1Q8ZR11_9HYPH|nr:hypothetical protein BJF95_08395 [Rhizobium oryziradicis]
MQCNTLEAAQHINQNEIKRKTMTSPIRTTSPTRAMPHGRQIGLNGVSSLSRDILAGAGRPGTVRNTSVRSAI